MESQLSYWLSTMNCNVDEEQRRNREISKNIDRQIKLEKNKREKVRIKLELYNTISYKAIYIVVVGASLQSAAAGHWGSRKIHLRQADEDF